MSSEIEPEKILIYLDGFIIFDETPDSDEYPIDPAYNKIITTNELEMFYDIAEINTVSYLGLNDKQELESSLSTFIYMWAAGLIYKKYDTRPNDLIDETYPVGYGDQLIISAKAGLKPYKQYSMMVW